MHNVKVEIVYIPIRELLFADGLDLVFVMEGVPKFGDEEEIFTLDKTFFYSTCYTLSTLDFVTVV